MALVLCLTVASGAMAAVPSPNKDRAELMAEKSLSSITSRIVNKCTNSSMTQFEKAVALYDWLIDNTNYGNGTDPYTTLRTGVGSCGGYTNAYIALLNKVGIKAGQVDGTIFTLKHQWAKIKLGGKWYHVDVRKADHMKGDEGRYRRFCMSDEQARTEYKFKNIGAKSYINNYAYRTGKLNSSLEYVRNAILKNVGAGEKLFIINLTASDAPVELKDRFNRIALKNVMKGFRCAFPGTPGRAKLSLSLVDNELLVRVKAPTYRVKKLTKTMPTEIIIEVKGTNFAAVPPLDLSSKILITPTYATNKALHWKSYSEKTAVVDQSGRVQAVGLGTSRILATTIDGSKRTCVYKVTVKQK